MFLPLRSALGASPTPATPPSAAATCAPFASPAASALRVAARSLAALVAPMALVAVTAVAVLGAPPASAAALGSLSVSEWKPFGLQGLLVRALEATGDLLCAGTEGKGVLCLDLAAPQGGWQADGLDGVTVTWIWIDPRRPEVRFAAASGSPPLYRTLDGGLTWEPIVTLPTPFAVLPSVYAVQGLPGSSTVFAAGLHIWRSDDLGTSWIIGSLSSVVSLEVAPTNPDEVWAGGETGISTGFTIRSLDGGHTWTTVWDSRLIGDNQTADIAAHPRIGGLVLTGHEGFVLRTADDGATFQQVLKAPARFFLDWDGGNPERAYAAGSPNIGGGYAFVSQDLGRTWADVTGTTLAQRTIMRLAADAQRLGVAYAATDDGVYRFYGGGQPLCHDARAGVNDTLIWPGVCPPIVSPGPVIDGDAVAADPSRFGSAGGHIDLGEVECLIAAADIAFATVDTPDPAPGHALAILARVAGAADYGVSSDGLPRLPSRGDCP